MICLAILLVTLIRPQELPSAMLRGSSLYAGSSLIASLKDLHPGITDRQDGFLLFDRDRSRGVQLAADGRILDLQLAFKNGPLNMLSQTGKALVAVADNNDVYLKQRPGSLWQRVLSYKAALRRTGRRSELSYEMVAVVSPDHKRLAFNLWSSHILDTGSSEDPMAECWVLEMSSGKMTRIGYGEPLAWLNDKEVVTVGRDYRPKGPAPTRLWCYQQQRSQRWRERFNTRVLYAGCRGTRVAAIDERRHFVIFDFGGRNVKRQDLGVSSFVGPFDALL